MRRSLSQSGIQSLLAKQFHHSIKVSIFTWNENSKSSWHRINLKLYTHSVHRTELKTGQSIFFLHKDHDISLLGETLWKLCEVHVKTIWNWFKVSQGFHIVFHIISQKCEIHVKIICEMGSAFSLGISQYCMWNTVWKTCEHGGM